MSSWCTSSCKTAGTEACFKVAIVPGSRRTTPERPVFQLLSLYVEEKFDIDGRLYPLDL